MSDENQELSERELEILKMVAEGASNKDIANRLHISTNTVKVHLRNIFSKMKVSSRTEATVLAMQDGLVPAPGDNGELSPEGSLSPQLQAGEIASLETKGWLSGAGRNRSLWLVIVASLIVISAIYLLSRPLSGTPEATSPIPTNLPTVVVENPSGWEENTPMLVPRAYFGSTLLENRIYVIAGETENGVVNTVESYDIRLNTWSTGTPKPTPVADIQAAAIGGKIYVAGGRLANGEISDVLEVYLPQDNTWEQKRPLPRPLSSYAAAAFEGKLYIFGGWDGTAYLDTVYVYDPETDRWMEKTPMPTPRAFASAVQIEDRIHVLGGINESQILAVHETYVPSQDNGQEQPWMNDVPLPGGRYRFGAASVAGLIYVVGGQAAEGESALPSLVMLATTREWQTFDSPPGQESWYASGLQFWGTDIYFFGGLLAGKPTTRNTSYQVILLTILPLIQQ
jgi:DNA-binding CsgD family transcriptional regulator